MKRFTAARIFFPFAASSTQATNHQFSHRYGRLLDLAYELSAAELLVNKCRRLHDSENANDSSAAERLFDKFWWSLDSENANELSAAESLVNKCGRLQELENANELSAAERPVKENTSVVADQLSMKAPSATVFNLTHVPSGDSFSPSKLTRLMATIVNHKEFEIRGGQISYFQDLEKLKELDVVQRSSTIIPSATMNNLTHVLFGGSALSSKPRNSMQMMFAMRHYHSFGAQQNMELIKTDCKHFSIDTLALAVKLKDKGKIDENLARAIIETIMQVYHANNHNASNLYVLKNEMEKLLSQFETEVKRSQVESDQGLRALLDEIKSDSDKLRVQLESTKLDIVKYCTGTLASFVTLATALLHYLS